jgi:ABC-type multidrug transport system fused ATPase/permease subunit
VLKRPDRLILDKATSVVDREAHTKVSKGLKEEFAGRRIIRVLHRPSLARDFDRALILSGGRLREQGMISGLHGSGSLMFLLIAAE